MTWVRDDDDRTVPPPERPSRWCRCPLCGGPALVLATVHCSTGPSADGAYPACRNFDEGAVEEIAAHERAVLWEARWGPSGPHL